MRRFFHMMDELNETLWLRIIRGSRHVDDLYIPMRLNASVLFLTMSTLPKTNKSTLKMVGAPIQVSMMKLNVWKLQKAGFSGWFGI